ncbi:MAG: sugar phosphate isomerase/epimerase [Deltaproteobacteria bacterium]|jgi:sugar phosphate isomerase/epimerase|nr:sugar phosphate isomerase/epimerase [Deltaproteobacteria bacterium]
MRLGVNLSFAVKRWLEPHILAALCRDELGVTNVQFTLDLIDPWWPRETRDPLAARYRQAFERRSLSIDSVFGGLAAYTYPQFLSPFKAVRETALEFFKRAVDLTVALGSKVLGTPLGGLSNADAASRPRRRELYADMLRSVRELAFHANRRGLREILIEATPLLTEYPHNPAASVKLMADLADSAVPVRLLIDWGHALYKPLLGEEADMDLWLEKCRPHVGAIHLQQTDGLLDRHWDFTKAGLLTAASIRAAVEKAGLSEVVQYLEVVPPFEVPDDEVLAGVKKSLDYLRAA